MARTFSHYERCIDTVRTHHPDMPRQSVILMRLGYHVFRAMNERLDAFFAAHQLSASAWAVLMKIYSAPDQAVTPSEISVAVVQSRTHMTRVADDLAAADHDSILSGNLIIGILKKPYDSHRGARDNAGGVRSLLPKGGGVQRMETVHVLGLGYGLDHFRLDFVIG